MSTERRISFPDEPLRRVFQEAKPAAENQAERNGQFYIWDDIISFPDSWTIPNRQIDIWPKITIPIFGEKTESKETHKPFAEINRQMHFSFDIPEDYVKANQKHFRNAKRGIVSRPYELPKLRDSLHERITKTFGLEDAQKPVVVWSGLFDNPKTPSSEFVYAERYPEDIKEEDRQNFAAGITRITEYATNFAAGEFLKRNLSLPLVKQAAKVYGMFSEALTYGLLYSGTYREMRRVRKSAQKRGEGL